MRKLVMPLLVTVAMVASSAAMAATMNQTTTGVIKALDTKACTVTLDDSKDVFHVHFKKTCDLSKLKVGEKVKVTWHAVKMVDWATKIVKA